MLLQEQAAWPEVLALQDILQVALAAEPFIPALFWYLWRASSHAGVRAFQFGSGQTSVSPPSAISLHDLSWCE